MGLLVRDGLIAGRFVPEFALISVCGKVAAAPVVISQTSDKHSTVEGLFSVECKADSRVHAVNHWWSSQMVVDLMRKNNAAEAQKAQQRGTEGSHDLVEVNQVATIRLTGESEKIFTTCGYHFVGVLST